METASFRRHARLPKVKRKCTRTTFVPSLPEEAFGPMLKSLTPDERLAMRTIVQGADLIETAGKRFLLVEVDERTLDTLAAFEAEMEDRENDLEDEPQDIDDDTDNDREESADREREDKRSRPPKGARKSREAFKAAKHDPDYWLDQDRVRAVQQAVMRWNQGERLTLQPVTACPQIGGPIYYVENDQIYRVGGPAA